MPILVANDKECLQGGNLILDNDKPLATAEFEGPMQMSFFDWEVHLNCDRLSQKLSCFYPNSEKIKAV